MTKLNGVVDNDELYKIGELKLKYRIASTASNVGLTGLFINSKDVQTVTIKGGAFVAHSDSGIAGGETSKELEPAATFSGNRVRLGSNTVGAVLSIPNKYSIIFFSLGNIAGDDYNGLFDDIDLSELRFSSYLHTIEGYSFKGDIASLRNNTSLVKIAFNHAEKLYGDISALSDLTALTFVSIKGLANALTTEYSKSNITGEIKAFAGAIGLTSLDISCTHINGRLEDLCEGMAANRTSGTLACYGVSSSNSDVTLNGVSSNNNDIYITFSNTGCVIGRTSGASDIATYTKSSDTWSYA